MFQIAQIQTELYFVLCRVTIFCAQQRIQQWIMGVDYRRSAGAVTPATGKKPPALRLGKTLNHPRLLPRYCFLYGDPRELNKAPQGLCLRCFHRRSVRPPPPAKNPQPCGWGKP